MMRDDLEQGFIVAERYQIEHRVAHGGMGSVYRAIDRVEDRPVALKLMGSPLGEVQQAERFTREAELLARLNHPRIVRYVGHGVTLEGRPYLAMEWLDGEDLRARLDRGPLALPDALRVLAGAAEALAAVHEISVVHRDLKPANLFLRHGSIEELVLLDFGIARRIDPTLRLTASGVLIGTPHYMSPEQVKGGEGIQPAADVFSLGAIFYECLAGKPPFDAMRFAAVLARILFDAELPIQALRPSVPAAWAELLARMLSKNPALRPQDAAALRGEISLLPPAVDEIEGGSISLPLSQAPTREGGGIEDSISLPSSEAPTSEAPTWEAGGEQVLVCVLLITLPASAPEKIEERETRAASGRHDATRGGLTRFGFAVEWLTQGILLATLSSAGAATDQAYMAARAALYAREVWPEARIALSTGRALLGHTGRVGEAVDRAARLIEQGGEPDTAPRSTQGVWVDTVTAGLLDARFVTVYQNIGFILRAERPAMDEGRLLLGKPTPCVGREIELAQLEGLMSRAVADGVPQAALVLAPPGTGKSRLRHELLRRLRDSVPEAEILIGHGDPLTAGSPYGLLREALRRLAGILVVDEPARAPHALIERLCLHVPAAQARRVGEFLGELCGIPFPADDSPPLSAARSDPRVMSEQIAEAFVDWLAAECAAHPVVLVLEDLQWGDALTIQLVEAALRDLEGAPLLLLAFGRPEVKELYPGLLAERALEVALRPLSRRASEALIQGVLGTAIGPETTARIVELARGNALFLEELIRAAAEGRVSEVPETVLAMLQARIGRLPAEARRALRAASIFGEVFWEDPVQELCRRWGASGDAGSSLEHLVVAELIQRRRQSRFPGQTEYVFRHALARDAAYGLLTEADRRSGHLFAGKWLEAMGDHDDMALAGHAHEGGDVERAIAFYTRAAEQSLGRNDLKEALARATKGVECGAEGGALGLLQSIASIALYGLGDWPRCGSVGLSAIEALPPGSLWWCRAAEKLFHVLPQVDKTQRADALFEQLLGLTPEPEARKAHLYALCAQVGGLTVIGARERARSCLDLADRTGGAIFDGDVHARGVALLWRAYFTVVLEPDPWQACSLAEQSERAFLDGQVLYQLCMARLLVGFSRLELGDLMGAEEACRRALSQAEQTGDGYHLANTRFYLAFVLTRHAEVAKLEEAVRLAQGVLEARVSPSYDACARWALASASLAGGRWAAAEVEALRAREGLALSPPYLFAGSTCLLQAWLSLGRREDAAALAREELERLSCMGGAGFAEVPFRVAAAQALHEAGAREEAEAVLREALRQIDLRASRIPDPAVKDSYLHRNQDVRRAFELARAWLGPES